MRFSLPIAAVLFSVVLLLFCATYYHSEIFYGPRGVHDWAQADRLALAIGYYDDGMNFFRPSTLSEWSRERVSGVEMPLQAYLSAAIAQVTGRSSLPLVARLVTLGICCTGAVALFIAGFRLTKDFLLSAFTPLTFFCSPVVIAYGASYLPDAAALSVFFIGLACMLRYFQNNRSTTLAWAMAWLAVAALLKTTLALYFLPIALLAGAGNLRRDGRAFLRTSWLPLATTVLGFAVIGTWYLHAQALNKEYESYLFLSKAQPFKDWEEASNYFNHDFKKFWLRDYFAWPQYGLLPVLLAVGLLFRRGPKDLERRFAGLLAVCLLGAVAAFCAMGHQLGAHDYYMVSMGYPLVGAVLVVACVRLGWLAGNDGATARRALRVGVGTALLFSFFFADFQYHQRISNNYPPHTPDAGFPSAWMEGGATVLDSLGIPATERILVAEEDAPNLGLVHFDRKGLHLSEAVYGRGFEPVQTLSKEHDIHIVVWRRGKFERALHAADSAYAERFEVLASVGDKVVLRRKD